MDVGEEHQFEEIRQDLSARHDHRETLRDRFRRGETLEQELIDLADGLRHFQDRIDKAGFDERQVGRVLANHGLRQAYLGYVGHMWELVAMYAWFSVFFSDALQARGFPIGSTAAYATFAIFIAGGLGCRIGGIIADRWGRANTTILMMAISALCSSFIGQFFGSSPLLMLLIELI